MYDCKHRIFRRSCCVCWWKFARNMFNKSSHNLNDIIYDTRTDFFMGNHSKDCKCGHCGDDRRYNNG